MGTTVEFKVFVTRRLPSLRLEKLKTIEGGEVNPEDCVLFRKLANTNRHPDVLNRRQLQRALFGITQNLI